MFKRDIFGDKAVATFSEAVNLYLDNGGSDRFLLKILDEIGLLRLHDINYKTILSLTKKLYPTAKPATINRQLITPIGAVFKAGHLAGLCDLQLFRKLKVSSKRLRWLTPAEAEKLIVAAQGEGHLQHMIFALLGSGMRTGEMLSMPPKELHLESKQAFLPYTKNGHSRMVEFPNRSIAALSTLDTLEFAEIPIFRTPKGRPYIMRDNGGGQIQAAFNKARKAAGLGSDVTPHTLRHTWATWFYAQTKDFVRLRSLGGWRDVNTVMVYTKLAPRSLPDDLIKFGWNFNLNDSELEISENPTDQEWNNENKT